MILFKTVALALLCLTVCQSKTLALDKMAMFKVTENVFMMENSRGSSNSTFIVTEQGVVVFDTDIRTADQTLAAIRKLTDKKVPIS